MLETYRVSNLDQLRLLADPLKLRIIQAFAAGPRTTGQVAESLGENLTRLYRHVDALLAAGLIEVTEERKKRGTVERSFQAVARHFEVDHALFTSGDSAMATGREILRASEEEILGALAAASAENEPLFMRLRMKGNPEQILSLRRALEDWLKTAEEADASADAESGDDAVEAGALIAFYVVPPATSRK
jgi:DNA-binding transcriptional ArsR family regulator